MRTFRPLSVPSDPAQLPGFLIQLQEHLLKAANRSDPITQLDVLTAEPSGVLVNGMEVEADGTLWNPGSGAGKYVRRSGAWVFIG